MAGTRSRGDFIVYFHIVNEFLLYEIELDANLSRLRFTSLKFFQISEAAPLDVRP